MITRAKMESIYQDILKGLEPTFAARVAAWRDAVIAGGVIPYVYCGRRTPQEQQDLYEQGRTTAGRIVTNAMGLPVAQSFHCYGRAIDWVPALKVKDDWYEADWGSVHKYGMGIENGKLYHLQALTWERPHLQDGYFKDWRDLAALEKNEPKQEPVVQQSVKKTQIKAGFIPRQK